MDRVLADRLIALAAQDRATRERLASDGSLFDGYHPDMQAVHESNARALGAIIDSIGWPIADRVGNAGAEAAWLIAQHAIGLPPFQRRCLELLKTAVVNGQAPAWQMAMMLDRIRVFEGRLQLYGSQFDWDDHGQFSPLPIEDRDGVDQRRAEIGLEPLDAAIANQRAHGATRTAPADLVAHRQRMAAWARQVGWR